MSTTFFHFTCPNGHKIKAQTNLAGRQGRCPACRVQISVPLHHESESQVPVLPRLRTITESGVMRVLGTPTSLPPPVESPEESPVDVARTCPRCAARITQRVTVCNYCHLYVGVYDATNSKYRQRQF